MLKFVSGNMFDSNADVLINTINCVGIMGKGIALAFKNKYPDMFATYRQLCRYDKISPGSIWPYYTDDFKIIVNFPTKDHWINPSEYSYIENGLKKLRTYLLQCHRGSIVAIPALGCGNGGLDWNRVKQMIEEQLSDLDHLSIQVFVPGHYDAIH